MIARRGRAGDAGPRRVPLGVAHRMFVGGAFVDSATGRCTVVRERSRAGRSARETVPLAGAGDADRAVAAARSAFEVWRERAGFARGRDLYRVAEQLEARADELERALVGGGLGGREARREVEATLDLAFAWAGSCDKLEALLAGGGEPASAARVGLTLPGPRGVIALGLPRRPALLPLSGALLPVLVAGNAAVAVAGDADPKCALAFCAALAASDLPAGLVSVLLGPAAELLPHLAGHHDVAALALHRGGAALVRACAEGAARSRNELLVRARAHRAWFDLRAASTAAWLEPYVRRTTLWHSCRA